MGWVCKAVDVLTGSALDLGTCSNELEYDFKYNVELDILSQRAALLSLYNSTGGPFWTYAEAVSDTEDTLLYQLIADVIDIGKYLSDPTSFNVSSLGSVTTAADLAAVQALSVNCSLQQALGFGEVLLKHAWQEVDKSYCQWHGGYTRAVPVVKGFAHMDLMCSV